MEKDLVVAPKRFSAHHLALMAAIACAVAMWSIGTSLFPAEYADLPPSFDGDRVAFFLALFGSLSLVCLAGNIIAENIAVMRLARGGHNTPIQIASWIEICWMATVILGIGPDAVLLLGWGETPLGPMARIDRFLDFGCLIPFSVGWVLRARGRPVIDFQLTKEPLPADLWPTWHAVRHKLNMLGLVLVICLGVALAK